jgi:hypothetical protein
VKKIINLIKNFEYLLILILILILSKNLELFKKTYVIWNTNVFERQQAAYDFCEDSGTGYIIYLKKKFNINSLPIIRNNYRTPDKSWIFGSYKNTGYDKNKIILINYNQSKLDKFEEMKFKVLDNYKDKCFYLIKND